MKMKNKVVSAFLALLMVVLSCTAAFAARVGDIDTDGYVTASDARLALRAAVGLEKYAAGTALYNAADADRDGRITAADARLLLRASVGLQLISNAAETVQSTYLRKAFVAYLEKKFGGRSCQYSKTFKELGIQSEYEVAVSVSSDVAGILSAFVDDFDGDSNPELLLVRLEPNTTYYAARVELYRIKGNTAECTLVLPIGGGITNSLDANNKVYLTQKDGAYYICEIARIGGTAAQPEDAYHLQVHHISTNDRYSTPIDLYTSTITGTEFNGLSVSSVSAAIESHKALFASVGLEKITASDFTSFPAGCGRLFECGSYSTEKAVKVVDYSGYLADS